MLKLVEGLRGRAFCGLCSFGSPAVQCYGGRVSESVLGDAFAHHLWATLRLVDGMSRAQPRAARDRSHGDLRLDPRDGPPPGRV